MSCIFGTAGHPAWEKALLPAAARLLGLQIHTAGIPAGLVGYGSAGACSCPRRCVWNGLDCSIVLNGFLSNRAELICLVQRRGFPLSDGDDGELALALYMLFGQECVHMLHGRFAFVICDASQQILFLARDRFGLCPLYYTHQKGGLAFSSDPRLLFALPGISTAVTRQGLWQLLLSRQTPQSVWRDVQAFPAGHSAIFRSGRFTLRRSWFLRSRPCFDSASFAMERLHNLQRQALEPYGEYSDLIDFSEASIAAPSEDAFSRSLQAADLPYHAAPAVLQLLQDHSGHGGSLLAGIGSGGLCVPTPQKEASLPLLNPDSLQQPEALACLQTQQPASLRARRKEALRQLLTAANCFGSLAQSVPVTVDFPFLDHRLIEYEYNLPEYEGFSSPPFTAQEALFAVPRTFTEKLTDADSPLLPFLNASAVEAALQRGETHAGLAHLALVNEWLRAHAALLTA